MRGRDMTQEWETRKNKAMLKKIIKKEKLHGFAQLGIFFNVKKITQFSSDFFVIKFVHAGRNSKP